MKKIYKIFIVIILLAVALGVGFYCGINSNLNSANSDKKDNNSGKENTVAVSKRGIYIDNWNGGKRYQIFTADVIGKPTSDSVYLYTEFTSNMKKLDIINSNKENHIGEITYYNRGSAHQADLFYFNNNYFIIYEELEGQYMVENCYMSFDMDGRQVYFPSPTPINIDFEIFSLSQEFDENELDYLYDTCTFEQAEEFYGRISDEFVFIDREKQQITLDGYDIWDDVMVENAMTLDFNNRIVILTRTDGNKTALDGTETGEVDIPKPAIQGEPVKLSNIPKDKRISFDKDVTTYSYEELKERASTIVKVEILDELSSDNSLIEEQEENGMDKFCAVRSVRALEIYKNTGELSVGDEFQVEECCTVYEQDGEYYQKTINHTPSLEKGGTYILFLDDGADSISGNPCIISNVNGMVKLDLPLLKNDFYEVNVKAIVEYGSNLQEYEKEDILQAEKICRMGDESPQDWLEFSIMKENDKVNVYMGLVNEDGQVRVSLDRKK